MKLKYIDKNAENLKIVMERPKRYILTIVSNPYADQTDNNQQQKKKETKERKTSKTHKSFLIKSKLITYHYNIYIFFCSFVHLLCPAY